MNQLELKTKTCNQRQARKKACEQDFIDFGLVEARAVKADHKRSKPKQKQTRLPSTL